MKIINRFTVCLASVCLFVMFFSVNAFSITAEVVPDNISINSFYHGSTVVVKGEAAADEDVIIKISREAGKSHLRMKGKRGGLLWMNVGELEFSPVSDTYLIYSTGDINMLNADQQDEYAIGYGALKRLVEVSPVQDEKEKEKWVDEFIRFKENDRIYGLHPGTVDAVVKDGNKEYSITIDWPYQAQPKMYTVSAYAVKDGVVRSHKDVSLTVETVGALKYISDKATNSASAYGIVSILIAIAAGFIVSVIFKGGGGSH